MSLERIAKELEETARQTGVLAEGVTQALVMLTNQNSDTEGVRIAAATAQIIQALQGQDRIEQRCANMAEVVRRLIDCDNSIDHMHFDEIWSSLNLDELAVPELSGVAARTDSGDIDLF